MLIHCVCSVAWGSTFLISSWWCQVVSLCTWCSKGPKGPRVAGNWRGNRRPEFDPWVGKISWRREWRPTPGLLPGESHGQRSLMGSSPRGCKESDMTEWQQTAGQGAGVSHKLMQQCPTYCVGVRRQEDMDRHIGFFMVHNW